MLRAASLPFPIPFGYAGQVQPYVLGQSSIPFIGLSSGSVSAVGAISGITALPVIYAKAYCWFPANALATTIAAGWYYCTFSSTTAGTAFLNTYTSGVPTIPTSPTAVTDGKGAFTGDTGEEFGPTITVPANAMGPNGLLNVWTAEAWTNSAGTKILRGRYSGNAGTAVISRSNTVQVGGENTAVVGNRGVTGAQFTQSKTIDNAATAATFGPSQTAVDTTSATTFVLSMQRNTATDNAVIEAFLMELRYGA